MQNEEIVRFNAVTLSQQNKFKDARPGIRVTRLTLNLNAELSERMQLARFPYIEVVRYKKELFIVQSTPEYGFKAFAKKAKSVKRPEYAVHCKALCEVVRQTIKDLKPEESARLLVVTEATKVPFSDGNVVVGHCIITSSHKPAK